MNGSQHSLKPHAIALLVPKVNGESRDGGKGVRAHIQVETRQFRCSRRVCLVEPRLSTLTLRWGTRTTTHTTLVRPKHLPNVFPKCLLVHKDRRERFTYGGAQ